MATGSKRQSKILWQITVLMVVILIVSFAVILFFNLHSTNNLIKNSKDKLVESYVEDISTGIKYITDKAAKDAIKKYSELFQTNPDFIINSIINKEITAVGENAASVLQDLIEDNLFGMEIIYASVPAMPPMVEKPMIITSNEDDLVFQDVPESIEEVYESDEDYGLIEDGIPEFGLEGEQLVVYYKTSVDFAPGVEFYQTAVKPIHEDLAAIDDYYNKEKKNTNIVMIIVIGASLLAVILVVFIVLRFLIRNQITKPIEELSDVAETVMDGNLDVEVSIREGEEFEGLKRAFNEMLRSLRTVIDKASGEQ